MKAFYTRYTLAELSAALRDLGAVSAQADGWLILYEPAARAAGIAWIKAPGAGYLVYSELDLRPRFTDATDAAAAAAAGWRYWAVDGEVIEAADATAATATAAAAAVAAGTLKPEDAAGYKPEVAAALSSVCGKVVQPWISPR